MKEAIYSKIFFEKIDFWIQISESESGFWNRKRLQDGSKKLSLMGPILSFEDWLLMRESVRKFILGFILESDGFEIDSKS